MNNTRKTEIRIYFFVIYFIIFLLSLKCMLITVDEYEGGNKIAEFGTMVFNPNSAIELLNRITNCKSCFYKT